MAPTGPWQHTPPRSIYVCNIYIYTPLEWLSSRALVVQVQVALKHEASALGLNW